MYNPKFEGVKNCFTYLTEYWAATVIDEHYSFPIYKYDSCKKEIAGKWSPDQTLSQEARFIPNPNGKDEDDGLILAQTYDFMK
jgi:carotenoid cleavage dioxygenase-like enzyme